jgi:hypothetical protein
MRRTDGLYVDSDKSNFSVEDLKQIVRGSIRDSRSAPELRTIPTDAGKSVGEPIPARPDEKHVL